MKLHNLTQGSPEWSALRARCHTASEAPAMMGASKYQSRSALLKAKATGLHAPISEAQQRLFDKGHAAEAAARPLVEAMIGEELFPATATDDAEYLLASSDGATMLGDIGFEHKLWSESLAAQVRAGNLEPHYYWQLEQQALVFGFSKIIFVTSDGTVNQFESMEYVPVPGRAEALRAGWKQFDADLANYQPVDVVDKPMGIAPESLPALRIDVTGAVTYSNLPTFKAHALAVIGSIKTDLQSDQDFADAEKTVKWLKEVEDKLKQAKQHALEQTDTIDALFKAIDEITSQAASTRLNLDKKVKSEKESRKLELVRQASQDFYAHCSALEERVGVSFIFAGPNFAEAIKGLKTIDSMRDKLSAALANGKVDASAIADRIEANRKTVEDMSLFPDFAQVCTKAPDDFAALMAVRISQREAAMQAERERMRIEEQSKAQSEAAQKALVAEQERLAAELAEEKQAEAAKAAPVVKVVAANDCLTTIKLGEICAALGFTVTADFLGSLGVPPIATDRSAKLYDAAQFPVICQRISDHVMKLAFKKAA